MYIVKPLRPQQDSIELYFKKYDKYIPSSKALRDEVIDVYNSGIFDLCDASFYIGSYVDGAFGFSNISKFRLSKRYYIGYYGKKNNIILETWWANNSSEEVLFETYKETFLYHMELLTKKEKRFSWYDK